MAALTEALAVRRGQAIGLLEMVADRMEDDVDDRGRPQVRIVVPCSLADRIREFIADDPASGLVSP